MSYNPLLEKRSNSSDEIHSRRPSFPLNPTDRRYENLRRTLSLISTILTPLLLFVIFVLLVLNLGQTSLVKDAVTDDVHHGVYGSDFSYMSLDHKYDYIWDRPELGDKGVLVPMRPGEEPRAGSIGMFHQLHCLRGFRNALQRAVAGEHIGIDPTDGGAHWPHCFHYMWRAIHCAADDTIERDWFHNGTLGNAFISGELDVRKCRNSDKLYALKKAHPDND